MLDLNMASKEELQDLMALCSVSTEAMAKLFFPRRFTAEFSPLHHEIFDAIDSNAQKIAIAAPRGIGKTSIVGLALAARKILFQQCHYVLYVSKSAENSMIQTENLKRELMAHHLVRDLFGGIKSKTNAVIEETFSKKSWVASIGANPDPESSILILPRGSGQQVRGLLHANYRPDLIIVDDLEDPDTIESDEQRAKRKSWFWADLVKCVSRVNPDYQIVYIDTLKHEDALLQHLLDNSGWLSIHQELCDDSLKSNAPTLVSDEEIRADYESYKEDGELDVWYRENRNLAISKEDAVFKSEYFDYYEPSELIASKEYRHLRTVVIVDPAKTVKLHSADSAIVGISVDLQNHKIYLRDVIAGKFYPEDIYKQSLQMVKNLRACTLAVEVTSLSEFIVQPFKNQMRVEGVFPRFMELNARGKKEDRVAALAPYYRQGWIKHNKNCCDKLEQQLLTFPRPKLWDVMDAFAYIVELMEKDKDYFDPEDFGLEPDEEEYDDIYNEDKMDDWRVY